MNWPYPLAQVMWDDAHGSATVQYEAHEIPHAPVVITTYGLLLRDDTAGITVAGEFVADGTFRAVTFIPRGMVRKVTLLRGQKKAQEKKGEA